MNNININLNNCLITFWIKKKTNESNRNVLRRNDQLIIK